MSQDLAAPGGDRLAGSPLERALAAKSIALQRELGRGGMSAVYLARDLRHRRDVAVKVLLPGVPAGAERFVHEIGLVAPLTHPHIVPLFDSGVVDGTPFFVMPYIAGESLRQRLRRSAPLEVGLAVRLAVEVGEALEYAHRLGIVHRDIKPENILLAGLPGDDAAVHALVADFGVARALSQAAAPAGVTPDGERLTDQGLVLGTAEYMSPEQASGELELDPRSDIYSLGCVLYEMLAGSPPFTGSSPRAVLARRFRERPRPLREVRPDVPAEVAAAVDRALATDPADRFPSAAAFVSALRGPAPAPPRRSVLTLPRARVAAAGLAVVAAALGLALSRRGPALDPSRIVVARLSNETGDSALGYLGQLATDRITAALAGQRRFRVATSATIIPSRMTSGLQVDSLDDPARLRRLAVETDAGTLVSGSFFLAGRAVSFQAEITNANNGTLYAAVGPVAAPLGRAQAAADSLGRSVLQAVLRSVPPRREHRVALPIRPAPRPA